MSTKWLFTESQLQASPSRADGLSERDELLLRNQTVSWIMDIVQTCKDALKPRYSEAVQPAAASAAAAAAASSGSSGSSGAAGESASGGGSHGGLRRGLFKEHHSVTATATVLFHRFYARTSFIRHNRLEMAIACVLTASAITDDAVPLTLWDKRGILTPLMKEYFTRGGSGSSSSSSASSGSIPAAPSASTAAMQAAAPPAQQAPGQRSEAAVNAKERLVKAQRVLLNTLEYELDFEPVTLPLLEALGALQGAHEVLAEVAKKSLWDALKTTLPLQLPPAQLALGVLQFAANKVEGEAARRALNVRYTPPTNWGEVVSPDRLPPAVARLVEGSILALHAATRGYQVGAGGEGE